MVRNDGRSSEARAFSTASEILGICFSMIVPGVLGYWLDRYLNVVPLFTASGVLVGLIYGFLSLTKLVSESDSKSE